MRFPIVLTLVKSVVGKNRQFLPPLKHNRYVLKTLLNPIEDNMPISPQHGF